MEKFTVYADAGSIALGTTAFYARYGNGCGDGRFEVCISSDNPDSEEYEFVDVAEGNFHLFNYDCLSRSERNECISKELTFKLNGQYGIYRKRDRSGDMYLQRWSDAN